MLRGGTALDIYDSSFPAICSTLTSQLIHGGRLHCWDCFPQKHSEEGAHVKAIHSSKKVESKNLRSKSVFPAGKTPAWLIPACLELSLLLPRRGMLVRVRSLPTLYCSTDLSCSHVKPHISAFPAHAKVLAYITARMPLPRHVGQLLRRMITSRSRSKICLRLSRCVWGFSSSLLLPSQER